MTSERALFPELVDKQRGLMPEGFRYEEDIISEADEAALAKSLAMLELKPFEFHGHLGNRRVASFGLRYDYSLRSVETEENRWVRMSHRVLPRSIYILEGEARTMWQHSIPPLDALRYSLTFRTLAEDFKSQ